MKKRVVTNNTPNPKHIGPYTLYPGQSREVEECYLGIVTVPAGEIADQPASDEWLDGFVSQKQDDEIEQLSALTDEQFARVLEYYSENDPPKKLAPKLVEELDSRGEDFKLYQYAREIAGYSDEDLQAALLSEADNDAHLQLLQIELSARSE